MPPPSPYYTKISRPPQTTYTERDYEEIYYHFDDYAAEILLSNASALISNPENPEQYEWEETILDEASQYEWESMKRSALFGLGCGIATFGLLRWRRGGMTSSPLGSSYSSRSSRGVYKFDPMPQKSASVSSSFQHQQQQQLYGNPPKSRVLLHAALSTILGSGISLLAIETDLFYPATHQNGDSTSTSSSSEMITPPPQWISPQIPLVPGRSMVSDLLCQPLTKEFRKFPKQLWQSGHQRGFENGYNNHLALYANGGWKDTKYYNSNPNASVVSLGEHRGGEISMDSGERGIYEQLVLDSLQGFIINCERRARYERKLRKISGKKDKSPVVIPRDGVPADEDLELDDIYFVDGVEEESVEDDDFGM
ncbi:hypothetical protein HJC23_001662 [Cyclotella cryptica]|uniref:Uncharacterized protein n=1 Tax=Cyclotella cryptica TaxID=29204 RepID=A0ABD3QKR3_9STRA|eukprot:CCRYP_004692-RA/>CCRYP_004692-RA protein AED:0.00 eAED:-0.00 QI:0/-1/0/1/-1/1/1/0/366